MLFSTGCGLGVVYRMRDRKDGGRCASSRPGTGAMPAAASLRHHLPDIGGAIARRSAILLGSTAAMALSIAQPVSAISINDQVAAAAGGIANYYDAGNRRSRRADPGAFSVDGNDHLRWRPVPLGICRGRVCGPARLLQLFCHLLASCTHCLMDHPFG